jgi:hypothetical protein
MLRQGTTPAKGNHHPAGYSAKISSSETKACTAMPSVQKRTARESPRQERPNKWRKTTVSTAEAALENQRIGGLQLRVAALCTWCRSATDT